MDSSTIGPAVIVQAIAVMLIQWAKKSPKVAWLNQYSKTASRVIAFAVATISAAGITWQWNAAQGDFVIHGLVWATVQQGIWTYAAALVSNELIYMGIQTKNQAAATGQRIGAPAVPVDTTAKTVTMEQQTKV
jgi:hypothetical protein